MVMEYLEGADLSDWLKRHGRLPIEQAALFVLQACEAIAEAHALGMVHRDLKPANLFVIRTPSGAHSVKVLDFGISKVTRFGSSSPEASMTKTSALMGSPLYMSPEQMQSSKDVDARSDIWALGVILYELITGECPFGGDTLPELIARILSTAPATLSSKLGVVPSGLEAVILKCLDRDRNARFDSIGALAVALLPFAPVEAKDSQASPVVSAPSAGAGTQASWGQTSSSSGRSATKIVGAVALLLALGAGAIIFSRRASTSLPAADSALAPQPLPAPSPAAPAAPVPKVEPAALAVDAALAPTAALTAAGSAAPTAPVLAALKPHPAPIGGSKSSPAARPAVAPAPPADPAKNPLKMKIE
jgi:serine/threonine protein kinase